MHHAIRKVGEAWSGWSTINCRPIGLLAGSSTTSATGADVVGTNTDADIGAGFPRFLFFFLLVMVPPN